MDEGMQDSHSALIVCPSIKSWKPSAVEPLLSVLETVVGERSGEGVLLDLRIEAEANLIEERISGLHVPRVRARPSSSPMHRVQRRLGVFTDASMLAVVIGLENGKQLKSVLAGDVIWAADFWIYPAPDSAVEDLVDPGVAPELFSSSVAWSLGQETGLDGWFLTALTKRALQQLAADVLDAMARHGLKAACEYSDR